MSRLVQNQKKFAHREDLTDGGDNNPSNVSSAFEMLSEESA